MIADPDAHARVRPIGDHGPDVGSVKMQFLVENGVIIGFECIPMRHGLGESFRFGRKFPSLDIVVGHYGREQ